VISVIVCSVDAGKFAAVSASYARAMGSHAYELIGIHDARSLCEGYNRGLQRAGGEYILFSHDDVELPGSMLGERIEHHFAAFDVFGIAGTTVLSGMNWAHSGWTSARGVVTRCRDDALDVQLFGVTDAQMGNLQALDGVWIAARADVAHRIRFDADTFDGWHGYDADFSFRCHLAGCRVGVVADIPLIHYGRGQVDAAWLRSARRFREKHGTRLAKAHGPWLDVLMRVGSINEVLSAYDIDTLRSQTARFRAQLESS
jgi:GT2 family glycosyltransferase